MSLGELNEWGIPNWRCARAYGDFASWNDDRWRWEFYRRREDLRNFFDKWAYKSRHLTCNLGLHPNDQGFYAFLDEEHRGKEKNGIDRFGYIGVPNPRIGDQPAVALLVIDFYENKFRVKRGSTRPASRGVLEVIKKLKRRQHLINLAKHEVAIRFDLDKPLTPQLEYAREKLRKEQKEFHSKLLQPRQNKAKWIDYLRALDGRADGATWAEITLVFYEDGTIDGVRSPEGHMECPPPQAGRQRHEQAVQLQSNL